jgi:trimeric autotransporter adhesin
MWKIGMQIFLLLALLAGLFARPTGMRAAAAAPPAPDTALAGLLNADGTLRLDGTTRSLDISGYSVQLDTIRGPVFSPAAASGQWSTVGGGASLGHIVDAIAVDGSNVYIGGYFQNAAGIPAADYIARWNGTTWSALGDDGANNGALNNIVTSILVDGSTVYVGGSFTNAKNHATPVNDADYIAMWDGSSWHAVGSGVGGNGSLNGGVLCLAKLGSDLYAGGSFTDTANSDGEIWPADYIARFDGSRWNSLGNSGTGNLSSIGNTVADMVVIGSDLYVGGGFINVAYNNTTLSAADWVARWNLNSGWSAVVSAGSTNGPLNSSVTALATDGTNLYAGGNFTSANNNGVQIPEARYIARWDGTSWSALGSGGAGVGALGSAVQDLTFGNGALYVAGYFMTASNNGAGVPAAGYVARWNGSDWASLGSNGANGSPLSDSAWALALSGSNLYVGGAFTTVSNYGTNLPNAAHLAVYGLNADITSPMVSAIDRADSSPNGSASVHYTVTFSEAVTGVDASDFNLVPTGITGATISNVSGSGSVYTLTVSTGSGDGSLQLNLVDDDSITDLSGNYLGSQGAGNGSFSGQTYTISHTLWIYIPSVKK